MEKYSFFNDVDNDRVYYAEDFAEYFIPFFTNGIFNNGCNVVAVNDSMSVNVETGRAFINGYRYYNNTLKNLTIENADGVLNRIDNIVIRLDLTNRTITAQVVKGSFSNSPVAPDLVRTSTVYDLRIAKISIPAGTTEITQDLITDTRFINSDCGNVISPIETPNTEDLFLQIQTQFENKLAEMNLKINNFKTDSDELIQNANTNFSNSIKDFKSTFDSTIGGYDRTFNSKLSDYKVDFENWFSNIQNKLSSDAAGSLQKNIDEVEKKIPTLLSQLTNDSNFVDKDVEDLANYELKTNTGCKIELSINPDTFIMTLKLKNSDNEEISTGTIDLPLETMVVNATYDSETKEIVLSLQSGTQTRFSVADLVSGLATDAALKTLDKTCVKTTGTQTVGGVKTFSSIPVLPSTDPTSDNQAVRKGYVDTKIKESSTTVGTLNTNNTTSQTVSSSESLSGTIKLHKVSKTGSYNDLNNKPTIPTKLSSLTDDIFIEASNESEAESLSTSNPSKFYYVLEE